MKPPAYVIAQGALPSPLGTLWLAASDQGLCGLWFADQAHLPAWAATEQPIDEHAAPLLQTTREQLDAYFARRRNGFDLPLDLRHGTPFQCAVWQALTTIPARASLSYGALAAQIGRPSAVRAVGAAVGRNPVGIIVPCHRVLGAQGALTGYTGGLWRKTALLRLEQGAQDLF